MMFEAPLKRLVENISRDCRIENQAVLRALLEVPRHLFVEEAFWARAYSDDALPIGFGQTISKPSTVAVMTEALEPGPEDVVLEVGTGSGYQAAVLSSLVKKVYSVERLPVLALRAQRLLSSLGKNNVVVIPKEGSLGWPENAPYNKIILTAAAKAISGGLLSQLAVGGCLVAPLAEDKGQTLRRVVRTGENKWEEKILDHCKFVPLISGEAI